MSKDTLKIGSVLIVFAVLLLMLISKASFIPGAYALPAFSSTITYYSDGTYTVAVGSRDISCAGAWVREGTATQYYSIDSLDPCSYGQPGVTPIYCPGPSRFCSIIPAFP